MKVLVDSNVVLDFLLRREPWVAESRELLKAQREGKAELFISANSLTDLFYVVRRQAGRHRAWTTVKACLKNLSVIPIGHAELVAATQIIGSDFEDNLQIVCAVSARVDIIVTRDATGFVASPIPVLAPVDIVSRLRQP